MSLKKFFQLQVMAALALLMVAGCGEGEDDAVDNDGSDSNLGDTESDTTVDTGSDTNSDTDTPSDTGSDTGDPTDEPIMTFTFDSGLQGWELVWTEPVDDTDFAASVTMGHTTEDGFPDAGAMIVTADTTGPDYKVQVGVNLEPAVDLTGRVIRAQVKLVEGLTDDPAIPGGTMVFVKTTDGWIWANGTWTNLTTEGGWTEVIFEVTYPDFINDDVVDTDGNVLYSFDITQVKQIGIHISTGSEEADTDAGYSFLPATVLIDSVSF